MNYAIIFAGGTGTRMKSDIPKQFMEIENKPILVHTLEVFQKSDLIDSIIIVCLKNYVSIVNDYRDTYSITKLNKVLSGGSSAFDSQRIGIEYVNSIKNTDFDIVFIHDGVRPLIDNELLINCYNTVLNYGTAITISPAAETIGLVNEDNKIIRTVPRQDCVLARAPQVFYVKDIYNAHKKAAEQNKEYIDSASMLLEQGMHLKTVEGPTKNIKITTQFDYELCKMILKGK